MPNCRNAFFYTAFQRKRNIGGRIQLAQLINHLNSRQAHHLAVVSHGWRNDENYATSLYRELFTNVAANLKSRGSLSWGLPTVVGVYWPSMALPEDLDSPRFQPKAEGAAAAATASPSVEPEKIRAQLTALIQAFGGKSQLEQAKALLDNIEDRPGDQIKFVELLRSVAAPTSDPDEDNSDRFLGDDPANLFERLTRPIFDMRDRWEEHNEGGAAADLRETLAHAGSSLLNTAQGALGSALRLVNYLTFYQMKERAGIIGEGLNEALAQIRAKYKSMPIHLVGHSFGARVITAAAARGAKLDPCSLSLLQGAYSHNGLAASSEWDGGKDGYFRVIFSENRVSGPIMATCTANDQAVGIAYPIASRLAGQNANALGDANDPFGGVGRNGIIHVFPNKSAKIGRLLPMDGLYKFERARVNNLIADEFIKNHGDVRNPQVANAIAQVIATL